MTPAGGRGAAGRFSAAHSSSLSRRGCSVWSRVEYFIFRVLLRGVGVARGSRHFLDWLFEQKFERTSAKVLLRLVTTRNDGILLTAAQRTPTTYGFAAARCRLSCRSGNHCGLGALAGATLASHPPEATRQIALAHALLRRCRRWTAWFSHTRRYKAQGSPNTIPSGVRWVG